MKKILGSILVACFCFMLVACTNTEGNYKDKIIDFSNLKEKTTKIVVWLDDTDGVFADVLIPAFNEVYPEIVVEFQHMSTVDARSKLKMYGKSGNGCDVFQFAHDHLAPAMKEDLLLQLPDTLKETVKTNANELAYDISTVENDKGGEDLYAVPLSIESVGLYYNKALIPNEDDLPTSFADLIEKAKAFEKDAANKDRKYFATSSHWADGYFNQYFFGAFGWRPLWNAETKTEDGAKAGFSDQKLANAVNYMLTEIKPITTGEGAHNSVQGSSLFEEGKLAILLTGPWLVPGFKKSNIDFGIMKMPTINVDGEEVYGKTFAGAQLLGGYKYTKHPEAVQKFLEFMASEEAAKILYETSGDCPALKKEILDNLDVTMNGETKKIVDDPVINVMLQQLETSIPMPTILEIAYYWTPAEDMMKTLWGSSEIIDNAKILAQLEAAETAFASNKALSK